MKSIRKDYQSTIKLRNSNSKTSSINLPTTKNREVSRSKIKCTWPDLFHN